MKKSAPMAEVTRIDEARARIEHLAYHDPLTGLPNRLLLNDRLAVVLSRATRFENIVAVFFLDVDNFKQVNDRFGHVGGDDLLREAARRLQALMRQEDTLARLGGDEFVVVAGDLRESGDVVPIAEKILAVLREPFEIGGRELFVTASIGVSVGQGNVLDGATLVHNADAAMYRAKEGGRDRYEVFSPELNAFLESRRQFDPNLRSAMAAGEVELAYQPILDIARGTQIGMEALARWPRPRQGSVEPAELIAGAEEAGLIVELGRSLLEAACRQASHWRIATGRELLLSVNVSPFQLLHPGFSDEVSRILDACSYPAAGLCIELSDRAKLARTGECFEALKRLKVTGVQVAVDDFGAGTSSLRTLQEFPYDVVKIDPSFVHSVSSDSRDGAITKSIVRLGHLLGATVVAEGVETAEELEFLRYHRCDAAQGWLFAPAVTPEDFERDFLPLKSERTDPLPPPTDPGP